ncbi:MAG: NAD(P)/FAD-dependent oxidoreductase, partial [Pseudomonadota bacterium]
MTVAVDTLILGAGAAGLFCGARTAARGQRTLVIDHARKPAEKVRISGGGRCNFTNLDTNPSAFLSNNPHFAKSALARYTPWDFCTLMAHHNLSWHEKTLGQLFCDQKSGAVIKMLLDELDQAGGGLRLETTINTVARAANAFHVSTSGGDIRAEHLIVATGGLSIPKMGATSLAYDIARQFGHAVVDPRPALVPLIFTDDHQSAFASLSGIAASVQAKAETGPGFAENMLFTHRGLSGPAILQASSYWRAGEPVSIDLLPGQNAAAWLTDLKSAQPRLTLSAALSTQFASRLASFLAAAFAPAPDAPLGSVSNRQLEAAAKALGDWQLRPAGTEGWRTAEVTAGGVDTDELSSRTMESKIMPGLYFIGECVDVTGWLGGYNF